MAHGWSKCIIAKVTLTNSRVSCQHLKVEVFNSRHAVLIMVGFVVLTDYLDPGQSKRSWTEQGYEPGIQQANSEDSQRSHNYPK